MKDKIDTQGLSGPGEGGTKGNKYPLDPKTGETIYPPMMIKPRRLFEDNFVKEMKILINEVLDEREYKAKCEGPYDNPEPLPQSYFDLEGREYPV